MKTAIRTIRVYTDKFKSHFGKLYLVSEDDAAYEEFSVNFRSQAVSEYIDSLAPVLVKTYADLDDDVLADAAEKAHARLIGAVLDSEQGAPAFCMMSTPEELVFVEAEYFALRLDNVNRNAVATMLGNLAVNSPETCRSYLAGMELGAAPCCLPRGRKSSAQKAKELELFKEQFVENMNILRNPDGHSEDEVAEAREKTILVLENMPHASIAKLLHSILSSEVIPSLEAVESEYLNLEYAAKHSPVYLTIRPMEKGEICANSDGKYRLIFTMGESTPRQIRITGKAATAIYFTVLLIRKTTGATLIEIFDFEKKFVGVYRALYMETYAVAKEEFDKIWDIIEDDGLTRTRIQGRCREYIPNICKALNSALGEFDNPAVYYYAYHYQKGGRIYVDVNHLTVNERFLEESERLENPEENAIN